MTKLHFDDLTQITCPFGMLDKDTQKRLVCCDDVQGFNGFAWVGAFTSFSPDLAYNPDLTYRQKPAPKTVTVYLYESDGIIFASTDVKGRNYSAAKLIATGEIVIEEDKE